MKSKWLSELKKIGFFRLGLLAVAAIVLIFCSLPQSKRSGFNQSSYDSGQIQNAGNMGSATMDDFGSTSVFSYEHELEARLEHILGKMEGITSVDVMITLSSTAEKVLEKSVQLEENKQEMEKGSGESAEKSVNSQTSKSSEALLTGSSSGGVPYVLKEISPSIQGVVIAAQGNITQTKIREISEAVQALFGVDAHKVKVIEKKSQAEEVK